MPSNTGTRSTFGRPRAAICYALGRVCSQILSRVQHPNVVRLLAACVTPPRQCLVMELMDTSLENLLYGGSVINPPMPLQKAREGVRAGQAACRMSVQYVRVDASVGVWVLEWVRVFLAYH